MCTLSWIRTPVGYHLFFNRDERPARAPGVAPEPGGRGDIRWLAPRDGESHGTWIGVNDRGVTLAILNRYHESPVNGDGPWVSRGLLVRDLLDAPAINAVVDRLDAMDRTVYQPFTLGVFAPGHDAVLLAWNGQALTEQHVTDTGLVATSSGHDQAEAARLRGELFARWPELLPVLAPRLSLPEVYEGIHASHWPESGPFSVCMHRPEARTVSFTRVDVVEDRVAMDYVPGPPGETAARRSDTLPIRLVGR